jgi:hypothetical protein
LGDESLFREINDRIDLLAPDLYEDGAALDYICECSDPRCADPVALTRAEFGEVRDHPGWIITTPGHGGGHLIRQTDRYWILQ